MPSRRSPSRTTCIARASVGVALAALASSAHAQSAEPPAARSTAGSCFGFTFGRWTPALDLRGAGHQPASRAAAADTAPGGREWAMPTAVDSGGISLTLFPAWWPAGVRVQLPHAPAASDTVRGAAYAYVADGRVRSPRSEVLAWAVPCGQRRERDD